MAVPLTCKSTVPLCLLCASSLADSKQRQNVSHGDSLVKGVLKDLLRGFLKENLTVDESSSSDELLTQYLEFSDVVCKSNCFASLNKLIKLTNDLKELDNKLQAQVGKSFCQFRNTRSVQQSQKRPSLDNDCSPLRKRLKKECMNTPTRKFLNSTVGGDGSSMAVVEKNQRRSRIYRITDSLKKIGRSVGRHSRKSLVFQIMKDDRLVKKLAAKIGIKVSKELMSSAKKSLFRDSSIENLCEFNWFTLMNDFRRTNPVLCAILEPCFDRNKSCLRKPDKEVVLSVIAGVLLRNCNQFANFLQSVVSMLLYSSQAPKQVYSRLQKACLCLSHKSTVNLVDKLGADFDVIVLNWKDGIFDNLVKEASSNHNTCDITERSTVENSTFNHSYNPVEDEWKSTDEEEGMLTSDDASTDKSSIVAPSWSPVLTTDTEVDLFEESDTEYPIVRQTKFTTFKLEGDNLDLFIRPRSETVDHHAESKHFFHAFAVCDRIDVTTLDNTFPSLDNSLINVQNVLPQEGDVNELKNNLTILMCRKIRLYMAFFRKYVDAKAITKHIVHEYSNEMSKKSEVVPLGVMMKNENKHDDMISIMEHLLQYVPAVTVEESVVDPESNETVSIISQKLHHVLFGGDQLTAERIRGCRRTRCNATNTADKLQGLVPVIEDWHSKVALLKAIWKRLYNTASGDDSCTLYYLRNLLQRRSVTKKIKSDPTACEEFFLVVTDAHIMCAVMDAFGMTSLEDLPSAEPFRNFTSFDVEERTSIFKQNVRAVVDKHFNFSNTYKKTLDDSVRNYADEVFSLGMFLLEFIDAIHEGDGGRILRCWKFMLLIFKASNKTKYSIEAFNLLSQYYFILSKRLSKQLLWSRTVNVHGQPGKNIPMDLHMEHMNRMFKNAISKLGPNTIDKSLERTGKALKLLNEILHNYDKATGIPIESGYHTFKSKTTDLNKIIKQLQSSRVFHPTANRKHRQFRNFKGSIMDTLDKTVLKEWMILQLRNTIRYAV